MTPSTPCHAAGKVANDRRRTAQVVPFAFAGGRRPRRGVIGTGTPSGQILLFTGVRYERLPEVEVGSAMPQRRRS